jgi:hypothetical protein
MLFDNGKIPTPGTSNLTFQGSKMTDFKPWADLPEHFVVRPYKSVEDIWDDTNPNAIEKKHLTLDGDCLLVEWIDRLEGHIPPEEVADVAISSFCQLVNFKLLDDPFPMDRADGLNPLLANVAELLVAAYRERVEGMSDLGDAA